MKTFRVGHEVADNLVPRHEAVRVIAAIATARQLHRPVGYDEAEAFPAPAPGLPHPAPLENDVLDARGGELMAKRQSGLSRADDDDVKGFGH